MNPRFIAWTVGTNTSRSRSAISFGVPSGAGQYAPIPPVFGPVSPSLTGLWSWHGGKGKIVRPLTSASTESSSPSSFFITGGGALFQLGPQVTAQQQTNVGVQSIAASNLGATLIGGSLQFMNSLKSGQANSIAESVRRSDFTQASAVLESAIDEVAVLRGRLGAFERNVLQTNVRSLQSAFENLSASDSTIRDADFAEETSALTRAQILTSAGTSVLALANQQSQQVLQLLG